MKPEMRLVVVEAGAKLPEPSPSEEIGDIVIVVQRAGERPGEVAVRVARHVARAESDGRRVRDALLVVGEKSDGQVLAGRTLLARALLVHQVRAGSGELVISAPSSLVPDARHELMALAGTITRELRGAPIGICVRFWSRAGRAASRATQPGSELPSGVYPAIPMHGHRAKRAANA
jgi:hypothetical protein